MFEMWLRITCLFYDSEILLATYIMLIAAIVIKMMTRYKYIPECHLMFPNIWCQVVIDEFEQRIEETHDKGVADDEVAQKASKASTTARAARGSKTAKTPGNCCCCFAVSVYNCRVSFNADLFCLHFKTPSVHAHSVWLWATNMAWSAIMGMGQTSPIFQGCFQDEHFLTYICTHRMT